MQKMLVYRTSVAYLENPGPHIEMYKRQASTKAVRLREPGCWVLYTVSSFFFFFLILFNIGEIKKNVGLATIAASGKENLVGEGERL